MKCRVNPYPSGEGWLQLEQFEIILVPQNKRDQRVLSAMKTAKAFLTHDSGDDGTVKSARVLVHGKHYERVMARTRAKRGY